MSHSLHRFGTIEDLQNDFCIYARCAKGVNRDNPGDKLRKILDIYISEEFVNLGSSHAGKSYVDGLDMAEYRDSLDHSYGIIINFSKPEAVAGVLRKIRDEELGISIVVSGLIEEVIKIAHNLDLTPHTATLSLGIFGKKAKLPKDDTLKLITMCGHSLVGTPLVEDTLEQIQRGKLTPEEGADIIARPCTCGIFNTVRCAELIKTQLAEHLY